MDFITVAASFISGLLCSMGFGGGSVLIIFLTSYLDIPQKEAQGINLLFFIPCAAYSVVRYKKDNLVNKKVFKSFALWGLLGVISGYILISFLPTEFLKKAFGVLLILMGLKDIFINRKKSKEL